MSKTPTTPIERAAEALESAGVQHAQLRHHYGRAVFESIDREGLARILADEQGEYTDAADDSDHEDPDHDHGPWCADWEPYVPTADAILAYLKGES